MSILLVVLVIWCLVNVLVVWVLHHWSRVRTGDYSERTPPRRLRPLGR